MRISILPYCCHTPVLSRNLLYLVFLLTMAPRALWSQTSDQPVTIEELNESSWDRLVPRGKEVDAIYGDTVLQNAHLRAVIARPVATRNANMTVRSVGGCLIDLTTREFESDQLSAFFPARRAFAFSSLAVSESASPPPSGSASNAGQRAVVVTAAGTAERPEYSTQYELGSDSHSLQVTSVWKNTTSADLTISPEDDLRADAGKEDMPKAPNGVHDLFWFQDIHWQQAYGIYVPGYRIRVNGNARESVLVYEPADGKPIVLKPGATFALNRTIFVRRHLPDVLADLEVATGRGSELIQTQLKVTTHGKPVRDARVTIRSGELARGTVVTGNDGTVKLRLRAVEAAFLVSVAGQNFPEQKIRVDGQPVALEVASYTPGLVKVTVTDDRDRPIPAKISFQGSGTTPSPNWGPETGEYFVRNLAYTPNGTVETPLQSGEYDVTVSHGPEFNADFSKVQVEHGRTSEVRVRLARVVSTTGWVSADFHSHSSPSGDNTSSQLGRVLNLAAEHIEFAPCTEHNRISTYDQHLETLQLKAFVATVSGMELTGQPLPLNHQNVFPLIYHPRTQDGGAPVTDLSPETQIERIAAWDSNSLKLIQQNHPDIGWLFFDKNGDKQPDEGYSRSFGLMNVMEIHPIDPLLNPTQFEVRDGKPIGNQTALNWLQLLNQGYRIYGVVNTDSHYNFHGSGGLRLWIRSTTDEPTAISSDEMRDASRNGQLVMSNGPFLEASFRESGTAGMPVISGQDLTAKSGKISATVRVQCPNWMDVDTVFILVNGRRLNDLTFSRETHPDLFRKETIRFEKTIDLTLKEDAHLVVVTGHRTQTIGDVMGPMWGSQHPAAVANPVFVDLQGDGFTSNKDTLDIPLPVKFVAQP